jgi:hypothetical protein
MRTTVKPWYQKLSRLFLEEASRRQVPEALQSQYVKERVTFLSLLAYLDESERSIIQTVFFPATSQSLETHELKVKVCILACEDGVDASWNSIQISKFDKLFMLKSRKEMECETILLTSIFPQANVLDITEQCFKKLCETHASVCHP